METCSLVSSALPNLTAIAPPSLRLNPTSLPLPLHRPRSPPSPQPLLHDNPPSPSPPSRRDFIGLFGMLAFGVVSDVSSSSPDSRAAAAESQCELSFSPSGLGFCDTTPGSGLQASKGMLIKANYVGKLENGNVFDSSYNRGKPLTFRVGVGEVIKGWDQGILGGEGIPPMSAGGKRTLRIPPQLGYGDRGAGCKGGSCIIPPNSVLLFDVEFVGKV